MDTITQITLGAAVGELTLGKKVGNKAVLWGAVAGTIPDLDVVAGPFLDSVSLLAFHRSFSHSILFALLFAPLMGYALFKLYKSRDASVFGWTNLAFWGLLTHALLDCFTSYGTELFWPFSGYRVALNSISVIDPLYTVPFIISVAVLMFMNRGSWKRRVVLYAGLAVSTLYLGFTYVNKIYVNSVFAENLKEQGVENRRLMTFPTPLNNMLWRGVAETENGFYEGYFSILDGDEQISFDYTPKNHDWLQGLYSDDDLQTLLRLNKGFFAVSRKNGHLYINDMRYGTVNGWDHFKGDFIYSFRILNHHSNWRDPVEIRREMPDYDITLTLVEGFVDRMFGAYARYLPEL
ncbi:MAG: metal-dependent hydrolase [Calditrichia bacterium]